MIPEAFISEMLALQDYSQGLSKVADVLAKLSDQRSTIDQELAQLTSRKQHFGSVTAGTCRSRPLPS